MIHIPITDFRKKWGDHTLGIYPDSKKELVKILRQIPEVRLIKKMDTLRSQGCHWYVFHGQEWYEHLPSLQDPMCRQGITIITAQGYKEIGEPIKGDIAVYSLSIDNICQAVHYGICCGNDKVKSKFGMGNVYMHPATQIPDIYGDELRFFRKTVV